jgi:hypothetical protein
MNYNIPDNYETFVLHEREQYRLNRLKLRQDYEEIEETDDYYEEGKE